MVATDPTSDGPRPGHRSDALLLLPLLSSGGLAALMYTAVSPTLSKLPEHVRAIGDGTLTAQVFMAMPSFGMMLGGLLSASLVVALGARGLLFAGFALYGLSGGYGLLDLSTYPLLVSRLTLGFGAAAVATAATTLIGERFDDSVRARLIGYQSSIGPAVGLASTLLAGVIGISLGWRAPWVFYLMAFALLACAIARIPGTPSTRARTASPLTSGGVRLPWARLAPVYLSCLPLYVAVFMTTTQVPFLLRDDGVGDPAVQSWVLAMSALWNAIGAGCYGRLRTVVGAQRTLAFALAFMAGGHVALGLSHHAIESAVGCAITGIGTGLVVPHVPNAVLARVDGAARGRALGLMVTALYFGSFCSPLLVAPVASGLGRHAAFLVSGALLLLVTLPLLARAGIRSAVAIGRT